jgi:hypothetical protein
MRNSRQNKLRKLTWENFWSIGKSNFQFSIIQLIKFKLDIIVLLNRFFMAIDFKKFLETNTMIIMKNKNLIYLFIISKFYEYCRIMEKMLWSKNTFYCIVHVHCVIFVLFCLYCLPLTLFTFRCLFFKEECNSNITSDEKPWQTHASLVITT